MSLSDLNRRDFTKLTMAALGGIVAGTAAGCAKEETKTAGGSSAASTDSATAAGESTDPAQHLLVTGTNVCRGLNTCKNHKGGTNECAGRGACATAAEHSCHTANACKGEGGCGEHPGENACKGKGECAVPLMDDAWPKARAAFEKAMTAAGKTFGDAPPKS